MMTPDRNGESPHQEEIATVLSDHPVAVGILFGSQARGDDEAGSDVDVAVAFENLEPGDPGYNEALFGVSTDLAMALATDDVDVVDVRRTSPSLARQIFEEGTVLVGTDEAVQRLRASVLEEVDDEKRSPADRFDDVLAAIDDHLA